MTTQIIMVLKTNAPTVDHVAEAIHKHVSELLFKLNSIAPNKLNLNEILSFEAVEIKPGSRVTKYFKFPDDLDTIKPQTHEPTNQ